MVTLCEASACPILPLSLTAGSALAQQTGPGAPERQRATRPGGAILGDGRVRIQIDGVRVRPPLSCDIGTGSRVGRFVAGNIVLRW